MGKDAFRISADRKFYPNGLYRKLGDRPPRSGGEIAETGAIDTRVGRAEKSANSQSSTLSSTALALSWAIREADSLLLLEWLEAELHLAPLLPHSRRPNLAALTFANPQA